MKKAMTALILVALALSVQPAGAKTLVRKSVTFEAAVACGLTCAYQIDQRFTEEFLIDEMKGADSAKDAALDAIDGEASDASAVTEELRGLDAYRQYKGSPAAGFSKSTPEVCSAPFPEGSWDDVVVKAPKGAKTIVFEIFPSVDWDSFICSKPTHGNNGRELASGANSIDLECTTSCAEKIVMRVKAGRRYVLRAYNFSDPESLPARYRFLT